MQVLPSWKTIINSFWRYISRKLPIVWMRELHCGHLLCAWCFTSMGVWHMCELSSWEKFQCRVCFVLKLSSGQGIIKRQLMRSLQCW